VTTARALTACAVLALGAHAALLMPRQPGSGHAATPAGAPISVRLQPADEPAPPTAAEPEPAAPAGAAAATPQQPEAASTQTVQELAPAFDGGLPSIGFPDAPLPEGGADVRAYLLLDDAGAVQTVSTAASPQLPPAFQKVAEMALRQARLQVSRGTAYCLLVRFEVDASEARLAWLPGAAQDAARCLAGALPAPREIVAQP
jgi:hypothetical protein